MTYDFAGLLRFVWRWLSMPGWTCKRAAVVVAFLLLYPLHELVLWLCLGLDRLFYADFRQVKVQQPVFIVGNFRSGTTFIHRLIAKDTERFSSMLLWEILIAPSISERRLLQALGRFERWIGRPVGRIMQAIENQWADRVAVHEVSMTQPEEDDYLGLHIWSVFVAGLSSGVLEEAEPFAFFDQRIAPARRERIMAFYHRCIQRHLYANSAQSKQYLAKNPALSPKLRSLLELYPDAKIIHMVRNPLETVPSFVSMMSWAWTTIDTPTERSRLRDLALKMAAHWYRYPLEILERRPDSSYAIVKYEDLVADPAQTVRDIYRRLELPISSGFEKTLAAEKARAKSFSSRHQYDLAELGLSQDQIVGEFADIFERFGFDTQIH